MGRNELKRVLDSAIAFDNNCETWIYGIGDSAELYQQGLEREGISSWIAGYCVDNYGVCGTFHEKKIIDVRKLEGKKINILVCSLNPKVAIILYNKAKMITENVCLLDEYVLKKNSEKVLAVYDMFEDQKSRDVYEELIFARIQGRMPKVGTYSDNAYFCWNEFSDIELGKTFIDCGAYVGDTIDQYIWKVFGVFDKIIAFEPDANNRKSMSYRLDRLQKEWNISDGKIEVITAGLSDKSEIRSFTSFGNGLGSKFADNGELQVEVVVLDDVIEERVDFLKADVESFEYRLLSGGKELIKNYKPLLAICIYHNAIDMFSVPLLIASMDLNYKFAVRHHGSGLLDTVLYAWVE